MPSALDRVRRQRHRVSLAAGNRRTFLILTGDYAGQTLIGKGGKSQPIIPDMPFAGDKRSKSFFHTLDRIRILESQDKIKEGEQVWNVTDRDMNSFEQTIEYEISEVTAKDT